MICEDVELDNYDHYARPRDLWFWKESMPTSRALVGAWEALGAYWNPWQSRMMTRAHYEM
jgi:hypothetical protein